MMKRFPTLLILCFTCVFARGDEYRSWTSADNGSVIEAILIANTETEVTLQRADGREFTFPVERLSEEDRQFLAANQRQDIRRGEPLQSPADLAQVLRTIRPGRGIAEIEETLDEHPQLESSLARGLRGRTGLSGLFSCDYMGQRFTLYVEFGNNDRLIASSLRGEAMDSVEACRKAWEEFKESIGARFGDRRLDAVFPDPEEFPVGSVMITDVWNVSGLWQTLAVARTPSGWCLVLGLTGERPEGLR